MIKGWSFAKIIDLPVPTANLTDFPVEVPIIADADIGAECLATGYDLRFTAADGITPLPYERESFAVADGEATGIFWVKTDVATAGTYIWCYYGNAAAGDVSEVVRDPNYVVNGGFDSGVGSWAEANCSVSSIAGGQRGNCLEMLRTDKTYQYVYQTSSGLSIGPVYRLSAYVKSGSAGNDTFTVEIYRTSDYLDHHAVSGTSSGNWVKYAGTFESTATAYDFYLVKTSDVPGTMLFDSATIELYHSDEWSAYEDAQELVADGGLTWGAELNVKSSVRMLFES